MTIANNYPEQTIRVTVTINQRTLPQKIAVLGPDSIITTTTPVNISQNLRSFTKDVKSYLL